MLCSRHWIYYQCFSARTIKNKRKRLTLNNYILEGLLVLLTSATDLVSQPVALVVKHLAMLENWNPIQQLALGQMIGERLTSNCE